MANKSKGLNELLRLDRISQEGTVKKKTANSFNDASRRNRPPAPADNFEEQERRIGLVVGKDKKGEVKEVNDKTLATYQNYLQQHLEFPCQVTGTEDFRWEEYYIIGPGSKKEHDRLRKTQPSYLDTYELLKFESEIDDWTGLLVAVNRLSDRRKFVLPLADLEAFDRLSNNYQLINDYVVWFVNWR